MLRACLYFLAGVYAVQLSSFAHLSDLLAVALVAFCFVLSSGGMRAAIWTVIGATVFLIAVTQSVSARLPGQFAGDSIVADVKIVSFPDRRGLNVSAIALPLESPILPPRVRLSWHGPPVKLRLGDVWRLEMRLRRPRGSSNPGVFDYEAWLLRERIGATGYVVAGRRNQLLQAGQLSVLQRARQRAVDRISALISDREQAAVMAAISVGARHLMSSEQWQRYARTGTSHLMAISGLHIGMAAAGGYFFACFIGGLLRIRINQHGVATIAAAIVAIAYATVSGLAIPAQRASLMLAMLALAVVCRRQLHPLHIVCAASIGIASLTPLATMAPGFKLSFAAVVILIWLANRNARLSATGIGARIVRRLGQFSAVQVFLLLGLVPLTVTMFGRIALAAPLVNLIAVPVFTIIVVPFTLAGLVLDGVAQTLGDFLLQFAASSLGFLEQVITAAASVSYTNSVIPSLQGIGWVFLLLPLTWVLLPAAWPGRAIAWLGLISLLLLQPKRAPAGCFDVDVLDVGQGLATVVTSTNNVVLFDTGPAYRGGGSAAANVLLPFLASRGIQDINTLVVSHADLDHAGGINELDGAVNIGEIRVGEPLRAATVKTAWCTAGDFWVVDSIEFRFLHPDADYLRAGNDTSCVLLVSAGAHRLLLSGDIERPAERALVNSGGLPRVDVVVVPHHGSRTSSSPALIQALQPSVAVVSAGFGNRWGFPKAEVIARWQAAGASVYSTAASGAISLRLCRDGGIVSLHENRVEQRRIWHE